MINPIHPNSYHELRKLIRLHGLPNILAAAKQIDAESRAAAMRPGPGIAKAAYADNLPPEARS